MLEALGGEIVAWEANPDDRARLDSIFRFVHTVKGNCGFFDFPRLEALSHAAEDALADCRAGRRAPDAALVSAVLAVIDRIGEMIAAIDAGEEFPDGRRQLADRRACARRRRAGGSSCCSGRDRNRRQGQLDPAHHPPVGRVARPGDVGRVRHGAGPQRACPPPARSARRGRGRRRIRAAVGHHRRNARCNHPHAHAADREFVRRLAAHGPRPVGRAWQAGAGRYRRRRCRAGSRNDRDDPRSADPHHPQCGRSWHRIAGRAAQGGQARNRPAVGLGAPVGQPDPDRDRRRRQRHRRHRSWSKRRSPTASSSATPRRR